VAPRKRLIKENLFLLEPELSAKDIVLFTNGINLFNRGMYWDAHESWEEIWQKLGDESEDDWEILLRGLIQVAASLHCVFLNKKRGARGNLKKGWSKISLWNGTFLGLDLSNLSEEIEGRLDCPECMTGYILK
tara:strand:- start:1844 stop:2242 length:399 start_codon:yes stop_codon:yes gene_type:complete